jgi:hypothetical protein
MASKTERTVWVLDTETKGTGAEMVPLDKLRERRRSQGSEARTTVLRREARAREVEPVPQETREPHRFRVVSVMTGQVLADDVEAREAVEALRSAQSVYDVRIYVWEPAEEDWRPLSLGEKKAVWAFRD